MYRGTTPLLVLNLSAALSWNEVAFLEVTLKDDTSHAVKLGRSSFTYDSTNKRLVAQLTQDNTLGLSGKVRVQMRYQLNNGLTYATNVSQLNINGILNNGVLGSETVNTNAGNFDTASADLTPDTSDEVLTMTLAEGTPVVLPSNIKIIAVNSVDQTADAAGRINISVPTKVDDLTDGAQLKNDVADLKPRTTALETATTAQGQLISGLNQSLITEKGKTETLQADVATLKIQQKTTDTNVSNLQRKVTTQQADIDLAKGNSQAAVTWAKEAQNTANETAAEVETMPKQFKTVNGESVVGSGNIVIDGMTDAQKAKLAEVDNKVNTTDVATINGQSLTQGGNLTLDGKVKTVSVNGGAAVQPDANGNVDLTVQAGGVQSVGINGGAGATPDANGKVNLALSVASLSDGSRVGTLESKVVTLEQESSKFSKVTPTAFSGTKTKIADIVTNGVTTSLYAPNGGGATKIDELEDGERVDNLEIAIGNASGVDTLAIESWSDGYVFYANGLVWTSSNYQYSELVDISQYNGETIYYSNIIVGTTSTNTGLAFYDSSSNYISGKSSQINGQARDIVDDSVVVPNNAKYVRFTRLVVKADECYFNVTTSAKGLYKDVEDVASKADDNESRIYALEQKIGTDKETCIKVTNGYTGKCYASNVALGDVVTIGNLTNRNYYTTYVVPTNGAVGIWAVCRSSDSYYDYVVVDGDNKVIKVGTKGASINIRKYIDLTEAPTAKQIFIACGARNTFLTHVFYSYSKNDYVISQGKKVQGSCNAELVKCDEIGMKAYYKNIVNDGINNSITLTLPTLTDVNTLGFWVKAPRVSETDGDKISAVEVTLYNESTPLTLSGNASNNLFVYNNEWVYFKVTPLDNAVFGNYVTSLKLTFAFTSSQPTTCNLPILVGEELTINDFNKPIFVINFDGVWGQTDECGAYDLLINNKVPFTITGDMSSNNITDTCRKSLQEAYNMGLLDVGKYGADNDGGFWVTRETEYDTLISNIHKCVDVKNSQGYECTTFGASMHICTKKMTRALLECGFNAIRLGNLSATMSAISRNINCMYMGGVGVYSDGTNSVHAEYYMNSGSIGGYFAHGISSNPSAETNYAMFSSFEDFKAEVETAVMERSKGGLLIMNMKQYVDFIKSQNL